jgi:hypothetical protein
VAVLAGLDEAGLSRNGQPDKGSYHIDLDRRPVFARTDAASFDEQIAFMQDAVAYLEAEPRIERYAWFSGRFPGIPFIDLLGSDGALTPLGEAYMSAPTHADCAR